MPPNDGNRHMFPYSTGAPTPRAVTQPAMTEAAPDEFGFSYPAPTSSHNATRPLPQGQSYFIDNPNEPTEPEASLAYQNQYLGNQAARPIYPPGFNSYDEDPQTRPSTQGRQTRVLQKPNRKFTDGYESTGGPGTSGAARRVMDFFRRRGKARVGDDR
jgi:protein-serine/threonine kinase